MERKSCVVTLLLVLAAGCGGGNPPGSPAPDLGNLDEDECGLRKPLSGPDGGMRCAIMNPMYHLGGDPLSDACADRFGPNDFWDPMKMKPGDGSDARVVSPLDGTCVNYDGVVLPRANNVLPVVYEMKNYNWDLWEPFIQQQQLTGDRDKSDRVKIMRELPVAIACRFRYKFVTTNQNHYWAVVKMVGELQQRGELPMYDDFEIVKWPGCPEGRGW